ncbi:MAG: FGGY-family carbohydrate kinase [Eubacteriales bacterium]
MSLVIAYDVGTTGIKTCVYKIGREVELVASAMQGYGLYVLEGGGCEQEPDEWWDAMCQTTSKVLGEHNIKPEEIAGISFCSQMQGLVLVDEGGRPVRRAMSYMDQRAREELKAGMANGPQIAGANVIKLIRSLQITGAVSASVKDPVWKYNWVRAHEPDVFKKVYKWLDVKEFLICRCTGEFVSTPDSAYATLLYDIRAGREGFSPDMCKMLGVDLQHLPRIIGCASVAGTVTKAAADCLGLCEGTPVFGGGGDASLIGIGAGAAGVGSTHIYSGTSGWVSTVTARQLVDAKNMIAAIVGANPGTYNYFAELETAGKCLEWVKEHLALDEIGIYLEKKDISGSQESVFKSLYDYMMHAIRNVPAGSSGVVFVPWMHGNRCPFEDPNVRGMFFNISLDTGKTEMIHAVLEGICYHLRWQLEAQEEKIKTGRVIRFVGGGALSPLACQILADVLGREIETVAKPQNVGAVGAAILAAVGLGKIESIAQAEKLVPATASYTPNSKNKAAHDRNFDVFKSLYRNNKKSFAALNSKN